MRINVAVPEAHVDAPVLDAALEATTRVNESLLKAGQIPTFEQMRQQGLRWRPEPPGQEHFDHGGTLAKRGWGDCDDLAPMQAASLRVTNEDPEAKAIVYRSGPSRWHAVVRRGDGTIDDPSKRAGMGPNVAPGNRGATVPTMTTSQGCVNGVGSYEVRPQIAMRPYRGAFQARADLPWMYGSHQDFDTPSPTDYAMTSLHTAPVASTALVGALEGAILLGDAAGFADPDHIDRLEALSAAIQGADYHDLAAVYGHEHAQAATQIVGSFFGSLKKIVPFASKAISFIPGIGPVASSALDITSKFLPGDKRKGGGAGGKRICFPASAAVFE